MRYKRPQSRTLILDKINPVTKNSELFELLAKYGTVERIKTIPGKTFLFVEMASSLEALTIEEKLNGYDLNGSKLIAKRR